MVVKQRDIYLAGYSDSFPVWAASHVGLGRFVVGYAMNESQPFVADRIVGNALISVDGESTWNIHSPNDGAGVVTWIGVDRSEFTQAILGAAMEYKKKFP